MANAKEMPSMLNDAPVLWLVMILFAATSCGSEDVTGEQQARSDVIDSGIGMLAVQKRPSGAWPVLQREAFCSGTLIAPDVVLTSGRCANVARTAQVVFTTGTHDDAAPTLVRSVLIASDALGVPCASVADPYADGVARLTDGGTVFDAAIGAEDGDYAVGDNTDPAARQAACRALAARCGVSDVSMPDAGTLACLHAQPDDLLQQAAFMGFAPGHDLGLLFLEQPVLESPATLAATCLQGVRLRPQAQVRTLHFARRGEKAPAGASKTAALHQVTRNDALRSIIAVQPHELRIDAESGQDTIDRGGALLVHYDAVPQVSPWHVTAVASRPWIVGEDTVYGMIYTRIDATALRWIESNLREARIAGRRIDGQGDAGTATIKLRRSIESCSQGAPAWWVPAALVGWMLHGARGMRRRARGRSMQALAALALAVGTVACGEARPDAAIAHGEGPLRQAIVQGSPAQDSYLAVGALVSPTEWASDPYTLRCTGTLIAPDVVLTAAHCMISTQHLPDIGKVLPKVGFRPGADTSVGGVAATIQVRHAVLHPEYWRATFANGGSHNSFCPDGDLHSDRQIACKALREACDTESSAKLRVITLPQKRDNQAAQAERDGLLQCINGQDEGLLRQAGYLGVQDEHDLALLFLETPVPNARVVRLPKPEDTQALVEGTTLVGVGYGDQHAVATALQPQNRQCGEKRVMRNSLAELGQWELRLGMGPPQACFADSGGPLFFSEPEAGATILGVVSRLADRRSSHCDRGVIYARVDRELDWIADTLEELCERGVRHGCRAPQKSRMITLPATTDAPRVADGCQAAPTPVAALVSLGIWSLMRARRRSSERNLGL